MNVELETNLMRKIRAEWGAAIDAAAAGSSIPSAFLAALAAGESGGDADARRFEKAVLASLWEVLQGRAPAYGSLKPADLLGYVAPLHISLGADGFSSAATETLQRLDGLATSWGPTQIMGYEAIPFHLADARALEDPATAFAHTMAMLADFAHRFSLNAGKDFDSLLTCWNTGRVHARTADPNYVPNGIARMQLYQQILDEPPQAMSA